ncbi:MAG: ABC transporter ATP-binding protein [Acidimicrobiia bacterium]|nr:ABC transporter ATP-binding protein [Acidimicrobiia bacterium]MCL4291553.1 ABC transporter ATP-binding protein [Acidimicrobiia bacterium]
MLRVDDLHVRYGTTHAVRGISLELGAGEAVALLGANGAGKTSTLRALSRLVAGEGRIELEGEDLTRLAPEAVARRGLIHVPEGRHVFATLTVHENILMGLTARGDRSDGFSVDGVYELFAPLRDLRGRLGYALSGGEQQMVALGRALVAAPRVLMVDEPSLGLAPVIVEAVEEALRAISRHTALLVVEQNIDLALRVCSRASIMKHGEIVLEVDAGDAHEREALMASYLGRGQPEGPGTSAES